ncbi:helix-turn-helix domain-containing protein [Paenibacillus humicola]|uniref:helix-turn-helix domain-containing protein n=1 Tax=Paenibacillus humicola TaxID=3110540 RepID=UPI00237C2E5F|nr:helix-turn-helix domain-containing protein [Paenibacillus humicola]
MSINGNREEKPLFSMKSTLLRRMIMLMLAAAVLPTVIVGVSSYLFSAEALQNEVNRANLQLLESTSASIDSELQNIQDSTLQMLFLPLFSSSALQKVKHAELDYNMLVSQFFLPFQNNHKLVLDISMYVKDNYILSSSSGLFRVVPVYDRNKLNDAIGYRKPFQWVNEVFRIRPNDPDDGITFISKLPLQDSSPLGLMLVRIDKKLFGNALQGSIVYPGQVRAVVDNEEHTVFNSSASAIPAALLDRIRESGGTNHKLHFRWNDRDYLVTTLTSPYTGWQYIDLIPAGQLNAKSAGIGVITAAVLAAVLLPAFAFTILGTRWLYRPVAVLLSHIRRDAAGNETDGDEIGFVVRHWLALKNKTSELQLQLSHQLPILQESFVMQTLQGHLIHYTQTELESLFQRYGLPHRAAFAVFVLICDRSSGAEGRFSERDQDLIVFAMKNIVGDMAGNADHSFRGIAVNLLNDQVAVLLWSRPETDIDAKTDEGWNASVKAFAEEARRVLTNYLRLPTTAGFGTATNEIRDLPQSFRQAVAALNSRLVAGSGQVIDQDNIFLKTSGSYRYPIELEQHYEESLKRGDLEEAQRMLHEFSRYVLGATNAAKIIHMSYTQLLGTTIRAMYLLGIDLDTVFKDEEPYDRLRKTQSMEELNAWFVQKLIVPVVTFVQNKTLLEHEQMIDNVAAFIRDHYDTDLSQDQCARDFGVGRTHLSKLFKRFKQVSFTDYVTQVRIEKAKELLRKTDLPVTDISVRVGYLHTQNFIRVFKKIEGVTPGMYREQS